MRRGLLLVCAGLVLLATGCGDDGGGDDGDGSGAPDATSGTTAPASDRRYYVSLGDSYASGYQPAPDGSAGANTDDGFAYQLPDLLTERGYDLELVNFGCGGATTTSIIETPGCALAGLGPDSEGYEGQSQADAAIEFLEAHPGEVALITVSIGGNDITTCARVADPVPCVTTAVTGIEENLSELLPRLQEAAGPETFIVGLTYPDVILGEYLSDDPAGRQLAELSVVAFEDLINPTLAAEYAAVDGVFGDVTAESGGYGSLDETTTLEPYGEIPLPVARVCELTWYCELRDIHPRTEGYAFIAQLVADQLPDR